MKSDESSFDVVVVGYGPTGLVAASLLSRLGHSVAVLERWPTLYGLPRLVNLDAEAARIVQAAGDVEVALQESTDFQRYFFKNASGQTLVDMDWSGTAVSGYPAHLSMFQPNVEDAVDAAVRERGCTVMQGWEAIGVDQDDHGVQVTARNREGNEERKLTAEWVIAADGANSKIRDLLGIERDDLGMRSAFLNLDMTTKRPMQGTDDYRFDAPIVVCAPPRMHVIVPIGTRRLRLELEVLEGDDREALLKPEAAWKYLRDWYDLGPDEVEVYRQVIYEFDSQLTKRWQDGRILLAGDAAHQMAPFLGQGACSGMRDAINLAWKLDLILRGVSDPDLLDSYEKERVPHVKTQIVVSAEMGKMATERDPEIARARDEHMLSSPPAEPPEPSIEDGILQRDSDGSVIAPAGELGPQGHVFHEGQSGRADDVLGWGFALLCKGMGPLAHLGQADRESLETLGARVIAFSNEPGSTLTQDLDGVYQEFFKLHDAVAVLVRPDFIVFGTAKHDEDVAALVTDLANQVTRDRKVAS